MNFNRWIKTWRYQKNAWLIDSRTFRNQTYSQIRQKIISQMRKTIEKYIRNCHVCKRSKTSRDRYYDLLNFFSISNKSWTNIIMNFVTELLSSKKFNVILMIVDRLTKMRHYILCTIGEKKHFCWKNSSFVD
jgi:hypothetical protein